MLNMKLQKSDSLNSFKCPEYAKAPGLFHVMEPGEFIGWRNGLILERFVGAMCAAHLVLSVKGLEKREFIFGFDRQRTMDFPVYWVRVSYWLPRVFGWPDDWKRLRLRHFIGEIEIVRGTRAMQLL